MFYRNFCRTGRHEAASTGPGRHGTRPWQASDLHKRAVEALSQHRTTPARTDS
jgi:hypothetical protein